MPDCDGAVIFWCSRGGWLQFSYISGQPSEGGARRPVHSGMSMPQFPARAVFSVLSLLVLVLAGCGTTTTTPTSGSGTTLRIWYSTDDPAERIWAQGLARTYESTHRGTHVQLTVYSFEDVNTKLQLALSSGHPPDLAYVTPRGPGIPVYVGAHRLLDLTAASQRHSWAAKLRSGLLSQYNAPFAGYGAHKGEILAVPTSLAAVAVMYNRHLLSRLHLSIPRSMAQFASDLEKAKAAGLVPIGMGNADGWVGDDWYLTLVNAMLSPNQLQPEQQLARAFSFRRPEFLQASATLDQWGRKGYFTNDFGGLDAQEGIDEFFKGKTLFQLISSSENAQIKSDQSQSSVPIGVFAFPQSGGTGRTMPQSGYLGWVIPKGSAHPAMAESFISSLLRPSTTQYLLQQGVIPAAPTPAQARVGHALRVPTWQSEYLNAVDTARRGIYLDAAPIANMNATMEANVQLLLQGMEGPAFLPKALQKVYSSRGKYGSSMRIDGEF